ncbi:MAG: alpha/beta hydrolase [Chthoniobacteraceae bacterium]
MNKNPLSTRGARILTAMALGAALFTSAIVHAADTLVWDKTFPQSDKVSHQKVTFTNRLGINLVADLYVPKDLDRSKKHPAIVVGGPYGAVKEQSAGLYAQTMAERGFVTIAHDPSYNGESGGQPHFTASSEALIEDFSAAVDFLGTKSFVDRDRIGVIGVCGSGSFGLAAAETDARIKAVATVSMYDIGQAHRQGLAEKADTAALKKSVEAVSKLRWAEVDGAERTMAIGTPQMLTEKSSDIDREFYDYYRTPRGQHLRSSTAFWRTGGAQMMLFWSFANLDWISPRPVLFITGDQAHSRIFSEHAFNKASEPKELLIVPNAGHVDLYDRVNLIPFDKLTEFFAKSLK